MEKLTESSKPWSITKRFFTLLSIYFAFLILDFTSSDELFPHFIYIIMKPLANFWDWLVPWVGANILKLSYPITIKPDGSGDTTYNYVLQLLWLIFSFFITIIWVFLDRKRPSYEKFAYWSRIIIRYYLAYILCVYGFVKIIKLQFPFPDLIRLTTTYGDSTPMGLAWTFVGYSTNYNLFTGAAEVLAGFLLFFRRTTLIGSLVATTILTNIVAMNFSYDIPVKIFSVNLLIMAIWIAWHDKDRLINFFFLNRPTESAVIIYPKRTKSRKILVISLQTFAILFTLYATLYRDINLAKLYGDNAIKPPLYGIYDIKSFKIRGQELPPLNTDSIRWKRIIINYPEHVQIIKMNDSVFWMNLKVDTSLKRLNFTAATNQQENFTLSYLKKDSTNLSFYGILKNDTIEISMKKFDHANFNLLKTGFNWINEYSNIK